MSILYPGLEPEPLQTPAAYQEARAICAACPAREPCAAEAIRNRERNAS